jgi:CRISPR-associated protein Cmr2
MKNQYLFLFTIGPVQSFIAQARKTHDLYAGSHILSELAKAGLKAATNNLENYIFPSDPSANSIPNRFLCIIETNNPISHGKMVEAAVRKEWERIAQKVLDFESIKGVKQQIDAHLEIYWAFLPVKLDFSDYKVQYDHLERLLGAVKNVRSFTQFNYQMDEEGNAILGEKGRKCSLDGERNVKFYRLNEKEQETGVLKTKLFMSPNEVKFFETQPPAHINEEDKIYWRVLDVGEGLSAVSMVKRQLKLPKRLNQKQDYLSTAEIALKYQMEQLSKDKDKADLYECYKNLFSKDFARACMQLFSKGILKKVELNEKLFLTEFNTQFVFEDNLTTKKVPHAEQLCIATQVQKNLKSDLSQRYYAMIDFDGDHMGKWLSGSKIEEPEKNLKTFHGALSKQLACFAKAAETIVDEYGQTVYAGGDDFLGFLNLNYLFRAMTALRNKFKELVNDKLQKLGYLNGELSFSAGVCIAHYKEPLSMVLSKANLAQKAAKSDKKGDRNAFCIVASKHSGENHETYFRWGADCKNVSHLEYIVNQLITENSYSNTFIKNLTLEFSRLTDNQGKLANDTLLKAETDRLVKRSNLFKRDYKTETKDVFDARKQKGNEDLKNNVMALFIDRGFDNFINALHICDFMHRLLATGSDLGTLPQSEKELCNQI